MLFSIGLGSHCETHSLKMRIINGDQYTAAPSPVASVFDLSCKKNGAGSVSFAGNAQAGNAQPRIPSSGVSHP
jgi:hypothetical protein